MSTQTQQRPTTVQAPDMTRGAQRSADSGAIIQREHGMTPAKETKPAVMSTEFWVYLAAVAGTLIASWVIGRDTQGLDAFAADRAWWLITLLTIGYLGSRGLAKAGSHWRSGGGR